MNMRNWLAAAVVGLSAAAVAAGSEGKRVGVSLPPLIDWATVYFPEADTVVSLLPPGASPHSFEPSPRQVAALSELDLYLSLGLPLEEQLLKKLGRANLTVFDLSDGAAHDHGHSHGVGEDPHFWLDPDYLLQRFHSIAEALGDSIGPAAREFEKDVTSIPGELLSCAAGGSFVVYHPSFAYLAERFNLEQIAIEHEGKEPTARQLAALTEKIAAGGHRFVICQKQDPRPAVEAAARALGLEIIEVDPLARPYDTMLREVCAAIVRAAVVQGVASE